MDEYAEYLYDHRPHYRNIDPGDLTEQRKVRTKLQCKPFKWFMENVAFDLVKVYPPVEPPPFASGEVSTSCDFTKHTFSGLILPLAIVAICY